MLLDLAREFGHFRPGSIAESLIQKGQVPRAFLRVRCGCGAVAHCGGGGPSEVSVNEVVYFLKQPHRPGGVAEM